MATIEEAIYSHLIADAGVSALVSTRVYPLTIPQDIALPAIAYQRISGPRIAAHDGPTGLARARIQVTCQASTYTAAKGLAMEVRQALDGFRGSVTTEGDELVEVEASFLANEWDGYETVTGQSTIRVDFMLLYKEATNPSIPNEYDWYVDSVNGSDSNSGTTYAQAFATIAKLMTVMAAGESVGLARGSHWREQLTIPGNNCTVAAYGAGNRPILDASNIIAASSITKTAGYTNVYQITVTPVWSTTNWLNLWEDDDFLTRAASLVACDSTPGSCYPSAETGTITLYFHAGDSSSPITNGKVYEYSHRVAGLYGYDCTGCSYSGIHTRRNLSKIASLVVGQNSTANDCYASDGNAHNIYCQAGVSLIDCTAYGAYNGTTAGTLIVFYQAAPGGANGYCLNCRCEMPAIDAYISGFYVHANNPNKWGTVTFANPTCINLTTAFSGLDANGFVITNLVAQNCTYTINNLYALTWTLTGATITGSITNLVNVTNANSTYNISNVDLNAACSSTVLFTDALNLGTFNVSGCNFRGSSFTGTCRICVLQGAAIVANFTNNVFGNGWTQLYYFQPIGTFTSDLNCFDDNTESFNINGTLYSTVTAYQTGSGRDANSTIGGCAS
jgi:hypothetical protein